MGPAQHSLSDSLWSPMQGGKKSLHCAMIYWQGQRCLTEPYNFPWGCNCSQGDCHAYLFQASRPTAKPAALLAPTLLQCDVGTPGETNSPSLTNTHQRGHLRCVMRCPASKVYCCGCKLDKHGHPGGFTPSCTVTMAWSLPVHNARHRAPQIGPWDDICDIYLNII